MNKAVFLCVFYNVKEKLYLLLCTKCLLKVRLKEALRYKKPIFYFLFAIFKNMSIAKTLQVTLTLFRMGGGGKKASPTSFSPVTSTNAGIKPQNFLTFSFNPFATVV